MVDAELGEEVMNLAEHLKTLTRAKKSDPIPGTVKEILKEPCPLCEKPLKLMNPCCGSPFGKKECSCGYKVQLTS